MTADVRREQITHAGNAGTLYVLEMTDLLTLLQKLQLRDLSLPRNSAGLGRRLRSSTFQSISILDDESAPRLDCLRRKATARPVGIFIPNDGVTAMLEAA